MQPVNDHRLMYVIQVRRIGGVPFGALVAFVIVGMVAVYASQQSSAGSRKRKGRSTDRTD